MNRLAQRLKPSIYFQQNRLLQTPAQMFSTFLALLW
jgi:hypothetical protein